MKSNYTQGKTPNGLIAYFRRKKDAACLIGGSFTGTTLPEIAKEFREVVTEYSQYQSPIAHFSLRPTFAETFAPARWNEIAKWIMSKIGLHQNRLFALFLDRKPHEHLHVVASRVDDEGKLWNPSFPKIKLIQTTSRAEEHFGLKRSPELNNPMPWREKLSKRAKQMEKKTGDEPVRHELFILLQALVESCGGWDELVKRAGEKNVRVALHEQSTGRIAGVSFCYREIWFRGSKLARGLSHAAISQHLEKNRQMGIEKHGAGALEID